MQTESDKLAASQAALERKSRMYDAIGAHMIVLLALASSHSLHNVSTVSNCSGVQLVVK